MKLERLSPRILMIVGSAVILTACEEEIPPPAYQMVPVAVRDIVLSASAAGTIEPVKTVEVKSKASGEIFQVAVETGDAVSRGDLLVRVDQRVPRNALVQAEADFEVAKAQLANAESQLRRAEALYETQSITEQEWENSRLAHATANAQLVRAERAVEDARISFEDTEVRAPANGVVLEKNVEVGTVIASASRDVGGGAVLLKMANLDTVQVRTLVDETDIGKIAPDLDVTITVDAYPNQPFRGVVLKIEPEAVVEQNVTMFPVLIRIPNERGLLRPGMNSEVEIHIGSRQGVVAVPNAALRTQRDVASAAQVLGIEMDVVDTQLAAAAAANDPPQERLTTLGGATTEDGENGSSEAPAASNTIMLRGRRVELPSGITRAQVQPIVDKMQDGGFQALSADERALMGRIMRAAGGGPGQRPGGRRRGTSQFEFGGEFIVFALRDGQPTAVPVRTGLTDLDYTEVVSGLTDGDTILVLPSASLIQQQQEFQERINRVTGQGVPGISRN